MLFRTPIAYIFISAISGTTGGFLLAQAFIPGMSELKEFGALGFLLIGAVSILKWFMGKQAELLKDAKDDRRMFFAMLKEKDVLIEDLHKHSDIARERQMDILSGLTAEVRRGQCAYVSSNHGQR